jgi:hypothetical protein
VRSQRLPGRSLAHLLRLADAAKIDHTRSLSLSRTCGPIAIGVSFLTGRSADWLAARLPVRRLTGGSLLDGELGRGICLKALVRDGQTAAGRPAVTAVFDPLEGAIERREPIPQTGSNRVVDALLRKWLRRIGRIAFGVMIICPSRAKIGQQLLHMRTLRVHQRSSPFQFHRAAPPLHLFIPAQTMVADGHSQFVLTIHP